MEIDVIVPVRRRATLERLLKSLSLNTMPPDAVTLVTNDLDLGTFDRHGLNVRILRFQSAFYPIGECDAALRRNVGIWASQASHVMTFDDDQIAPADLIQSTFRILHSNPFCWGHHRFLDFTAYAEEEIVNLPPEAGRARELPPNAWHSWRSAYAGLFAAERDLLQRSGGFDMKYSGRHGGEDQDLGRRLASLVYHSDAIYVHEPPFAWHPEHNTLWDSSASANVCTDGHDVVYREVDGVAAHCCSRCPFYWIPDKVLLDNSTSIPFDASSVVMRVEQEPASKSATWPAWLCRETQEGRAMIPSPFIEAYAQYLQSVSTADMVISLEAGSFLYALCTQVQAVSILDLGSGFSSYVLRSYAAAAGAEVWTADDDPSWLERTQWFLGAHGLATDKMLVWGSSELDPQHPFDLIFYDLGGMATRARELRGVLDRFGAKAILILDDMHKEEYAPEVERVLRAGGWRYFDCRAPTLDHFGRFCGVVVRADNALLCPAGTP